MTPDLAERFARTALGHLTREYPHKLDHVMAGAEDVAGPRALHPIFYGSYDWHSCVHGYWLALTLRRAFPEMAPASEATALADAMLTGEKVAGELAYLDRPTSAGFERPYGWAWLLQLHAEAARAEDKPWGRALEPLARAFALRFATFLPRQPYPIRTGTHFNTAFALLLALDWAESFDPLLATLIRARAISYYGRDRDCPAWEPGGDEFLSPALVEAVLMRRVLPEHEGIAWLATFLPRLPMGEPATLLTPAVVSDRSDGKIAHLDGLNLSRAWCWRALADILPPGLAADAAERHIAASLPHMGDDYMGEHWLATFAAMALLE